MRCVLNLGKMRKRQQTKIVREGNYLAEISVELLETDDGWSPYHSLEDAYKLDDLREALRNEDLQKALKIAKVYSLKPVAV
jgi:hypothetical protein